MICLTGWLFPFHHILCRWFHNHILSKITYIESPPPMHVRPQVGIMVGIPCPTSDLAKDIALQRTVLNLYVQTLLSMCCFCCISSPHSVSTSKQLSCLWSRGHCWTVPWPVSWYQLSWLAGTSWHCISKYVKICLMDFPGKCHGGFANGMQWGRWFSALAVRQGSWCQETVQPICKNGMPHFQSKC